MNRETRVFGGGGSSGGLELTDGVTDLLLVTKVTTTDLAVGGISGSATLKPNLTTYSAVPAADSTLGVSSAFGDICSIALPTGTFIIFSTCVVADNSAGAQFWSSRIFDATNSIVILSNETECVSGGEDAQTLIWPYVLAAPATIKLQACEFGATSYSVKKAAAHIAGATKVTGLAAVRIG